MKKIITYIGIATILFASCNMNDKWNDDEKIPANSLRITFNVAGIETEIATRSTVPPADGEDRFSSLYLLFFQPDASQNGEFVDYVRVDGGALANTSVDIAISPQSRLNITDAYNILALTNIDAHSYLQGVSVANWLASWHDKTEAQVITEAEAFVSGSQNPANDATNRIRPNMLLMSGQTEKAKDQFHIKINLMRKVVRFDVHNTKRNEYDLVSVAIWNAYRHSSIWGGKDMDFANNVPRIRRYYGVTNPINSDGFYDNITGGLYAFENSVAAPKQNDQLTTCLIIGLIDRNDLERNVRYYRANISPDHEAQTLKANNVYRLTIRNVNGEGYDSELDAYGSDDQERHLDYVINNWDMGDHSIIMLDGNSILAVPVKTIKIKPEGDILTFPIFTFNNAGANIPLQIISTTFNPLTGAIRARLNGNDLIVEADPMEDGETERTGSITLGYGGLTATVDVTQSIYEEMYLNVHLPAAGVPRLPAFANFKSIWIPVEASGDWTATIYEAGFSFAEGALLSTIDSESPSVDNSGFYIYTQSNNTASAIREGFVVVTLNAAPQRFASFFRIVQNSGANLAILPNLSSYSFSPVAGANITFTVSPGVYDDGGTTTINEWEAILMPRGAYPDDVGRFDVVESYHATNPAQNTVTVSTLYDNTSGRVYEAILRIRLIDVPSMYVDVILTQAPLGLTLTFGGSAVPVTGGNSSNITVNSAPTLQWSAEIVTESGVATDGRSLMIHEAELRLASTNAPVVSGQKYNMTERFYVYFPKVYYPNREIPNITAKVTVTVEGQTATVDVRQNSLISKGVITTGFGNGPGVLMLTGVSYNTNVAARFRAITGYQYLPPPTGTGATIGSYTTAVAVDPSTTFLHITNAGAPATNNAVTRIHNFKHNPAFDGIVWLASEYNGTNYLNFSNNLIGGYGYVVARRPAGEYFVTYDRGRIPTTMPATTETRIYEFLMRHCWTQLIHDTDNTNIIVTPNHISAGQTGFVGDATRTYVTTVPNGAVVMIGEGTNGNSRPSLIIDPANKLIFHGESQHFDTGTFDPNTNVAGTGEMGGHRGAFIHNLMYYVANAARYGSHFTDLLREDLATELGLLAPWDDAWGDNKWDKNNLPVNP